MKSENFAKTSISKMLRMPNTKENYKNSTSERVMPGISFSMFY